MKYEEFLKMEKVCKKIWKELAKTGSEFKPKEASAFHNQCPACEIARAATKKVKYLSCIHCPINLWRNIAINEYLQKEGTAVCDRKDGLYSNWQRSEGIDSRKTYTRCRLQGHKPWKIFLRMLLNLGDNDIWILMESFLGYESFNVTRMNEMLEYLKAELHAQIEVLRTATPHAESGQLQFILQKALENTFAVYEGSL